MKFTLSWLKEYLETHASLEEITDRLTAIGLEVEEVVDQGAIYAPFLIAHIIEAKPHPNADKLQICQVEDGSGKPLQIVCGAPNARAGIDVVLAPVGTVIPTNGMKIKASKIRDVASNGMLCSADELGLGEDSSGIMELDLQDNYKAGDSFATSQGLTDPMIEIAITPNRGDCLGVYGIARDLAAAGLGTLKPYSIHELKGTHHSPITIHNEAEQLAPYFIGRHFKNVTNGDSPAWLQNRLKLIGLKPISALVDITNYIAYSFGRPLHVYDADKLQGNLTIRHARQGEALNALNDTKYHLTNYDLVVADDQRPQAIAGVIGGTDSGCSHETKNVLLEIALFDADIVADMGRRHQIITDSRYRFERNLDAAFMMDAVHLVSQMIRDLCQGEPSAVILNGHAPLPKKKVPFNMNSIQSRGGVEIDTATIQNILRKLGFEFSGNKDHLEVSIPSWRHDVECEADLVEEVLRIYGYEHIPSIRLVADNHFDGSKLSDLQQKTLTARHTLSQMGYHEAVSWSFMQENDAVPFGYDAAKGLKLLNPISQDLNVMRPSILPNLLQAAKRNQDRHISNIALFEIGPIFNEAGSNGRKEVITAIRTGSTTEKNMHQPQEKVHFYDAKTDAFLLLDQLGIPTNNLKLTREVPDYYHPGRAARMQLGKQLIGYIGEIHPLIKDHFSIKLPVIALELFPQNLPPAKQKKSKARPTYQVSDFQPVERDFAFIIGQDVAAGELVKTIANSDKKLIQQVRLFDVYQGKGVEEGKKSVALSVTLQPSNKTLTEEEITSLSDAIIAAADKQHGAVLR